MVVMRLTDSIGLLLVAVNVHVYRRDSALIVTNPNRGSPIEGTYEHTSIGTPTAVMQIISLQGSLTLSY